MALKWDRKVRVLAADDSMVMRSVFRDLFAPGGVLSRSGPPEVELCGLAQDGVDCLESVARLNPDVLLLDMEMPRMGGLEVLSRLRSQAPGLATIMCSAVTARGARMTLDGLALGAADYVTKPTAKSNVQASMEALAGDLMPRVAALAGWSLAKVQVLPQRWEPAALQKPAAREGAVESLTAPKAATKMTNGHGAMFEPAVEVGVVAIGVSTGGPSALEWMLPRLPRDFPVPILIVQHMPKLFSRALAERLNRCCSLRVQEAHDGAKLAPGTIWLAPGDVHLEVRGTADGGATMLRLLGGEIEELYRPSVDRLFLSVAKRYGAAGLCLVLTGMGSDGLIGARAIRDAGGTVLVQDEATSAVWGMPGRVAEAGLAAATLPLGSVASELVRLTVRRTGRDSAQGTAAGKATDWEMNYGVL